MPSLKFLRNRIASVKSTKKITSAMKMVAASKLRQSQDAHAHGKPYASEMKNIAQRVISGLPDPSLILTHPLVSGTGKDNSHLLVVVTSDRGLCGGFNGNLVREAKHLVANLTSQGKDVKIICIGRKGRDILRREFGNHILALYDDIAKPTVSFTKAQEITDDVLSRFTKGDFDVCTVLYNRFINALIQEPTVEQLVPCSLEANDNSDEVQKPNSAVDGYYTFEPNPLQILESLLPHLTATNIYRMLLDSAAGEQAARMNAMDNATRNAGEMINKLTLKYNRARQANITRELIEIISAMEAM